MKMAWAQMSAETRKGAPSIMVVRDIGEASFGSLDWKEELGWAHHERKTGMILHHILHDDKILFWKSCSIMHSLS